MKPKNKFQAEVVKVSHTLPAISNTQKQWAEKNLFTHIARVTKSGKVSCLECGAEWHDKDIVPPTALYDALLENSTTCPHCKTELTIKQTRQQNFSQVEYLAIPTTCNGHQVLRFVYIKAYYKVGRPAHYFHSEVVQRWIAHNGNSATLALLRPLSYWQDTWQFTSDLELRPNKPLYDIMPTNIYPRMRVLPQLKRNGFKGLFHNLTPYEMFYALLTNNRAETLLKAGQTNLLHFFVSNKHRDIENYWHSIKIAIRNGYNIKNVSEWCDYIDLLKHFGKDTNSPKYICPTDLMAEHNKYVAKRQKQRDQQRAKEKRRKAIEDEDKFNELKSRFFGLSFVDGTLQLRVLDSVTDYIEEGATMHHCVFANDYHLKEKSLILSATIDGKRIATVEISLDTLKVVQCRGVYNKFVDQQVQITNLINKNINQIEKRLTA